MVRQAGDDGFGHRSGLDAKTPPVRAEARCAVRAGARYGELAQMAPQVIQPPPADERQATFQPL